MTLSTAPVAVWYSSNASEALPPELMDCRRRFGRCPCGLLPSDQASGVRGLGAIGRASQHLATLRRILAPASQGSAVPRWTATTRKLRDALVAVDGRAAGASYREIAVVLHGIEYVDGNWRTGLKERIRRRLQRGHAFATSRLLSCSCSW